MFKIKNSLSLLVLGSVFAVSRLVLAVAPENILESTDSYTPKVVCSDTYGEKTITFPGEGGEPPTHDVETKPQKISAKVVANITGFDELIDGDLEVSLEIGGFQFSAPLSDSDEFDSDLGIFPANKKKATFSFRYLDDNDHEKLAGKLVFAWTPTRLTVTLVSADIELAGLSEIGASEFIGLYEAPDEDHQSGSEPFVSEPSLVSVGFGSAVGERDITFKGKSKTTYKKFGSDAAGTLEEFLLESVTLVGTTDVTDPKIKVTAKDLDNNGFATVVVTTKEMLPPTIVMFNAETFVDPDDLGIVAEPGETDEDGVTTYTAEVPLTKMGSNTVYILATDESDNTGLTTKKVKTKYTGPFPPVPPAP